MKQFFPLAIGPAAIVTTTVAGQDASLSKYFVSPGKREMMAILTAVSNAVATDTYVLDVKIQESVTTVDTDFTDVAGAAFTQVNEATTPTAEAIFFGTLAASRYIRSYCTITGSGVAASVTAILEKRYS